MSVEELKIFKRKQYGKIVARTFFFIAYFVCSLFSCNKNVVFIRFEFLIGSTASVLLSMSAYVCVLNEGLNREKCR